MVKSATTGFKNHIDSRTTTVCWCVDISVKDRAVHVTNHVNDLEVNGKTYKSTYFDFSKIRTESGTKPSSWSLTLSYDDDLFSRKQVFDGVLERASVDVMLVNYNDTSQQMKVLTNKVKSVSAQSINQYKIDTQGLMAIADFNIGELYSPTCRNNFGGSKCGVQVSSDNITVFSPYMIAYNGQFITTIDPNAQDVAGFTNGDFSAPMGTGWQDSQGVTTFVDDLNGIDMGYGSQPLNVKFSTAASSLDDTIFSQTLDISTLPTVTERFLLSFSYGSAHGNVKSSEDVIGEVTVEIKNADGFVILTSTKRVFTRFGNVLNPASVYDFIPENAHTMKIVVRSVRGQNSSMSFADFKLRHWDAESVNPMKRWRVSFDPSAAGNAYRLTRADPLHVKISQSLASSTATFADKGVTYSLSGNADIAIVTVSQAPLTDTQIPVTSLNRTNAEATMSKVVWLSGANKGEENIIRVYDSVGGWIKLYNSVDDAIAVGDKLAIYPSCDKTLEVCRLKYNNVINFRGEPFLPGRDRS